MTTASVFDSRIAAGGDHTSVAAAGIALLLGIGLVGSAAEHKSLLALAEGVSGVSCVIDETITAY